MEHGVLEADRINWKAAKQMQKDMGHGMHEEPNSVLLEPGKSGEVVWTFPDHATLEFACNVPGHYDSGMVGDIKLSHYILVLERRCSRGVPPFERHLS